jgi:hypothetical protein
MNIPYTNQEISTSHENLIFLSGSQQSLLDYGSQSLQIHSKVWTGMERLLYRDNHSS